MSNPTSVTVPLAFPVPYEGREVKELTFRRMKAKDTLVAEAEKNQTRAGYMLFAALAGVDLALIEELDVEDLEQIGERIVPLMGKSAVAARRKALAAAEAREAAEAMSRMAAKEAASAGGT
ncbi:phage tail assembly protein [Chelativorans sp. ZYF759]|uniref:phage tail assembly protein n=1 Tax=Chelativorans sp. ZYF759 TaxID=2692213 RepID=UPI00145D9F4A|nr:phage tail assembly protein [Chelativorans sp. ZYF759]NMG39794.1 phage tail assembly protein [Chelativorans sp. ZYF759]